ncbi:MAG: magnesium-translocating P-type ATPase [Candidatus Aenigmatarchaeota archaeon]
MNSKDLLSLPIEEVYKMLQTSENGLSEEDAKRRLEIYGYNEIRKKKIPAIKKFLSHFTNPITIILIFAAIISFYLGEKIDASIIFSIILLSVIIDFIQEEKASKAAEMLKEKVAITSSVLRNGIKKEIKAKEIVPGDIVLLSAGDIVPADCRVISAKDFFVDESSLTGESYPVEKNSEIGKNFLYMGSSVISGTATCIVINTGEKTEYGKIVKDVQVTYETEYERNLRRFGYMLLEITFLLIIFIFFINSLFRRSILESLLFSLALAVGLTPQLLPLISTLTLSTGSIRMSKKGAIVKRLPSIYNFGAMDVLCIDKTGTLTQNKITLVKYVNPEGKEDENVFEFSYVNSYYQTGIKNPLDDAILSHKKIELDWKKIDEIPFDHTRRRSSIVVEKDGKILLITKGSYEEILSVCSRVKIGNDIFEMNKKTISKMRKVAEKLSSEGFRVLAVCFKEVEKKEVYSKEDENDMTLLGFLAFFDPPKESAKEALKLVEEYGIKIKILTGDDLLVTKKVCEDLGFKIEGIVKGSEIENLEDEALERIVEKNNVFVKVTPSQKSRIVKALRKRHVVGFLGDGVNDASSIKAADVGISVNNAVDIAKESADIILTNDDLKILLDGVIEGRKTIVNTKKYIKMNVSSNFGNMLSVAIGSLFLPFLPMLPTQILLNNFLYDTSQLTLPLDKVDDNEIKKPNKLDINLLKKFLMIFGPISSIFDLLMFIMLLKVFTVSEALFQTTWFVESILTQTLVIFSLRTSKVPFIKSKPYKLLTINNLLISIFAILIPFLPIAILFKFVVIPFHLYLIVFSIVAVYLAIVEIVKKFFYSKFKE